MRADEGGVSWEVLLELEILQNSNDHEVGGASRLSHLVPDIWFCICQ